jgi:hypothetical protein
VLCRPPDILRFALGGMRYGRSGSYRDPRPKSRGTSCGLREKGHASTVEKIGMALPPDAYRVDEARGQAPEWWNPPIPVGPRLRELLQKLPICPEHP